VASETCHVGCATFVHALLQVRDTALDILLVDVAIIAEALGSQRRQLHWALYAGRRPGAGAKLRFMIGDSKGECRWKALSR
jgi:hypothetical protein